MFEVVEFGDGGLDGADEIWELVEGEVLEVWEVADVRRDLAGDLFVDGDSEGDDAVGDLITLDAVPSTAIFFGLP